MALNREVETSPERQNGDITPARLFLMIRLKLSAMEDLQMSNRNVFGVIIEMSQREPWANSDFWNYSLLGHFDEMKIQVVDDVSAFSVDKSFVLTDEVAFEKLDGRGRLNFHPESQKLFFYVEDSLNKKRDRLEMYSKGEQEYGYIALVAVKSRHQFKHSNRCGVCHCIEGFVSQYIIDNNIKHFEYCVMDSLGIDDVYILICTDNPNTILRFIQYLQLHTCHYNCNNRKITDVKNSLLSSSDKLSKLLEYSTSEHIIVDVYLRQIVINCRDVILEHMEKQEFDYEALEKALSENRQALKNRVDKIVDDNRISLSTSLSYGSFDWIMSCYNSIRSFGSLPVVMRTHTVIGHKNHLHDYGRDDIEFCYEMRMNIRPGANYVYFNSGYSADEVIVLGRHDMVWKELISEKDFMSLYKNLQTSHTGVPSVDRQFSGHFIIDKKNLISNELTVEQRYITKTQEAMFAEDALLSRLWVEDRHRESEKLFRNLRNETLMHDFPFLKPLINAVDRLHMQGCRKFYYAMNLHEFEDTRKFFDALYESLGGIFNELIMAEIDSRADYARMFAKGLELTLRHLSLLFNDRMILDVTTHENTRPSLYATGAYEALLKRYSDWTKDLRGLLMRIDGKRRDPNRLHFILVPVERNYIHTDEIFPITNSEPLLIVHATDFDNMLDIHNALPSFAHETGHYLGIVYKNMRVRTYIHMVSFYFSMRLTRTLCFRNYSPVAWGDMHDKVERLADNLFNYLYSKWEKHIGKKSLIYAETCCTKWLNSAFNNIMFESCEDNSPELALAQSLVALYDEFNCVSFIRKLGPFYLSPSERAAEEEGIGMCAFLIRESYADLVPIRVLNMTTEDYFRVMLTGFKKRNEKISAASTGLNLIDRGNQVVLDAIRAFSVMLQTEVCDSIDDKDAPLNVRIKAESAFKKVDNLLHKTDLCETWSLLRDAMNELLVVEVLSENHDLMCVWRLMIPYLRASGKKIKSILNNVSGSDLHRIRDIYSEISKRQKSSMEQLSWFLENGWDGC
jgi:hypothetical protein